MQLRRCEIALGGLGAQDGNPSTKPFPTWLQKRAKDCPCYEVRGHRPESRHQEARPASQQMPDVWQAPKRLILHCIWRRPTSSLPELRGAPGAKRIVCCWSRRGTLDFERDRW